MSSGQPGTVLALNEAGAAPADDGAPEDPYDRDRVGYSLANNRELVERCLEACDARSVVEVGAQHGLFTRELLAWAGDRVEILAIDPLPEAELIALAASNPSLRLVEAPSLEAIPSLPRIDAYILDGDHNYHTVTGELEAIELKATGAGFPLVLFHDVCWPHARRDSYYAPDRIPAASRQPIVENGAVSPWEPGITSDGSGIPFSAVAAREGGTKNGVLTAIEDFLRGREGLRFARIPAFFGFGALWPEDATWAPAVEAIVAPLDNHPVLERLEGNRVAHLLERQRLSALCTDLIDARAADAADAGASARIAELEAELNTLLGSRAFAVAERISTARGSDAVSRERLRKLLSRDDATV